jgi:hypothetical protein
MTTLTLAQAPAAAYPVVGPAAIVPGTSLALPLMAIVSNLPVAQRCPDCAGTGVAFLPGTGLTACPCMEPDPPLPAAMQPRFFVEDDGATPLRYRLAGQA